MPDNESTIRRPQEAREQAERDYEAYRNAAEYWRETALGLERERNRYIQATKQRDHFANLLCLAARFAEQSLETQVEADNGEIVDGSWLAAKVRDELEERE